MILNKRHEVLEYLGQKYEIGDIVIAKNCYPYEGLCGVISEIRTDEDKETENCGIDIYCNFFMPYDKEELKSILERFGRVPFVSPSNIVALVVMLLPDIEQIFGNIQALTTV